ncbi:MAG: photosystem II complex extrinsic protein PsbU [Cyanothece sp. SIO1E1]|nr:photosystem II complex extrinsic protein PsbU [Cyanothece sp. SIO1E1]
MKRLVGLFAVFSLLLGCLSWISLPQTATAAVLDSSTLRSTPMLVAKLRNAMEEKLGSTYGEKIDVNNSNIRAFRKYPGMYPTIGSKIIRNAPYQKVEDVLNIPGLSAKEKEILQANMPNMGISPPDSALVEGDDRYNPGLYGG